jgi:hypothetical protein
VKEFSAEVLWALYASHGLGEYVDWLAFKKSRVSRDGLLEALQHAGVREAAKGMVTYYENKAAEVRQLLVEAEQRGS